MSEFAKTVTFVAVGAAALVAAYFINAPKQAVNIDKLVGTQLYADVEVDAPKRLRIVKFDRQTAETKQFEVASIDGVWSIPSKQDYPADATAQMAAAANALIDRKILRVAGETAQTHDQFGVLDPLSAKLDSNSTGVGTRVTMMNADDKPIVDMIIGKAVKGAEGQRYVRENNKDVVYIVELDTTSLSTSFDDWIEDDLLKISPFDIRKVFINDYSADLGFGMTADGRIAPQVNWERRGEITLGYDNDDAKWTLTDLKKYDRAKKAMVPDALAADEEINQEALNELRTGLDDLLIVDVAKKPDGLSADLKAGNDFLQNQEAFRDLVAKGFSPLRLKDGDEMEILSSEGELVVTQRDGVEYVLRFGQLKVQTDSVAGETEPVDPANPATGEAATPGTPAADPTAAAAATDEDGKNLHRYLFVMARFNEDVIEKPELKDLPEAPKVEAESAAETPKVDEAAGDAAPAGEAAENPATGAEDAAAPAEPPAGGDEPAAAEKAEPTDETSPEAPEGEEPKSEEPKAEETPAEEESANGADAAAEPSAEDKLAEERKAVEQENQRMKDQYNETVEAGKKRVAELNERFGDWYYVISNDVYKQIHLGRDQVIKKKDAPKPEADAAAPGAAGANPLSGLPNLPIGGAAEAPPSESEAAAESK